MKKELPKRKFAFIVPTLGGAAVQNEDIIQLLIFAAAKFEQEIAAKVQRPFSVTVISVEHDFAGWKTLSSLFSEAVLEHVSLEALKEPATPNLAIAGHKPAYNFYEYLKESAFDEVHCLDRFGIAYYPTLAKQLGLYFLDTVFAIHVVGSTVFRKETEDALLDDVGALMDDLLERGSLERADAIFIHDRLAYRWYLDKTEASSTTAIYDLAWAEKTIPTTRLPSAATETPRAIIFYGSLGSDGGLPLFCDAVSKALPLIKEPVEVFFVGSAKMISGMDAVSYIRLRSTKWGIPITIKRELSIQDEIAFIVGLNGVVICDSSRRESLRSRLIANSGMQVLQMHPVHMGQPKPHGSVRPATPGQVAQKLVDMFTVEPFNHCDQFQELTDLWQAGRRPLPKLEDATPSPPLQILQKNKPKVTVCITHYRRPQKLRMALASLGMQTYDNFEVIVVDDGSPDPEVQKELKKIKQEIEPLGWRVLVQENRYLGAARNYGVSRSTGDYLMFMDDDNVAKPNEIETLVAIAKRTKAGIVTSFCDVFYSESDLDREVAPMRFAPFGPDPALGALSNCYGDANALYSRKVFDKLGGFTEDYGITHEDWELFCRASLDGVKMVCVPEPLFWYRIDQGGMFRGQRTQLHKSANLRRHIRPFLEKLPYYQAKLVQLAQGLTTELPMTTVDNNTRTATPMIFGAERTQLPYARVAVIMRTKDRPILLRRAIQSVIDQTFQDWLLVIVNDGGNPEGVELVVGELAEELAGRVLILHHPISLGMQTASNAGISSCDSEFIIIHDDDDSWNPTFLARTISLLDNRSWDPQVGGAITWSQVIVEELSEEGEVKIHDRFIFNDKLFNISLVDLAVENRFPPISFIFRRAAMDAVGPFQEQHGVLGDWDFHLRILGRFNIEVIPEPLANYHHRTKATEGVYGNSVHAQNDVHRSKRIDLLNGAIRNELTGNSGVSVAHLLTLGNLQNTILEKQSQEFKQLHDYIWTIEQRVKHISSHIDSFKAPNNGRDPTQNNPLLKGQNQTFEHLHDYVEAIEERLTRVTSSLNGTPNRNPNRNLARNGDFRLWSGAGRTIKGPSDRYAFAQICPGFLISYDGKQVSYRVDRRKWVENGEQLAFGKTYLHLEHDGQTIGGSWFILECVIPSVLPLSGKNICISGLARLKAPQDWINVSGRFDLGNGRELSWREEIVPISTNLEHWSCSITCPTVHELAVSQTSNTRIFLKFPHNQPFEFDLTNLQVEVGITPTEFVYNGRFSLRERLYLLWNKIRPQSDKAGKKPMVTDSGLGEKLAVSDSNYFGLNGRRKIC